MGFNIWLVSRSLITGSRTPIRDDGPKILHSKFYILHSIFHSNRLCSQSYEIRCIMSSRSQYVYGSLVNLGTKVTLHGRTATD
jgi:hypothetical protein